MDTEITAGSVLLTLLFVVGALGFWYCGVRWNKLVFKQFAVMMGIAPVIGIGLQVFGPSMFENEYRLEADGPAAQDASIVATVPVKVNDADVHCRFELVPRIRGNDSPKQPVHLKYTLRSPKGETLAQGEGDLAPARWEWYRWGTSGQPMRWDALKGEFQPREEGDHLLILEIPQPVRRVDIFMRERNR